MSYRDNFGRVYEQEVWENCDYDPLSEAEAEVLRFKQLYELSVDTNMVLMARIRQLERDLA